MRRKAQIKRTIQPDPKYQNILVARFINQIMRKGKKSVAQKIVYGALENIAQKTKRDALEVFDEAVANVAPILEVKSKRIGGATYQVPREVRGDRKITLAMRWIVQVTKNKKGASMAKRLADELILAAKNEGAAIKKRQDTHRMAEANRAFARFAW